MNFKEVFSSLQEPEYVVRFARIFWRTLLFVAVALVVFFSVFGIRQLSLLSEFAQLTPGTANPVPPFDRGKLDGILSAFVEREERYGEIVRVPPNIADPSR